jgi:hypothetical protein
VKTGNFSEEALYAYAQLVTEHKGLDFAEGGVYDFARCVRPDGTAYGTKGKCRKGTEEAKQEIAVNPKKKAEEDKPAAKALEEKRGYKPKESPEQRGGLRGLKDRLTGGKNKNLDSLVESPEKIKESLDSYTALLEKRILEAKDKKTKKAYQGSIDRAKSNAEIELGRVKTNKKFAQDLKANLPANVKASVNDEGQIVLTQKVGKNTIETTFNQDSGFNYRVNGGYDAGTVKDRREQLRVAMAVRGQYDALVRSLPEGTVIKTSPYNGDGGGAARQKAYEKIGFGKPGDKQEMFAMKKDGRMVPATAGQYDASFENTNTIWFAEDREVDKKEEVKAWFQIVTGTDVGV